MIAIEIALLLVVGIVIVVGIANIGKPLTQAWAKYKYEELGTEAEVKLKKRVDFLEGEIIELKKQLTAVQETADYAIKQIEATSATEVKIIEKK